MIRVGVCFDFTAHQICQPFQISCLPVPEYNGWGRAYKNQGRATSAYGTKCSPSLQHIHQVQTVTPDTMLTRKKILFFF